MAVGKFLDAETKEIAGLTKKLDDLQGLLSQSKGDLALLLGSSLPPPAGTAADIASLGVSIGRGDWGGAFWDVVGLVPIVGDAAKGAVKGTKLASKVANIQKKIAKGRKAVDAKIAKAKKNAEKRCKKLTGNKKKKNKDKDAATDCGTNCGAGKNTKPPKRKEIELEPGQKGGWNKDLNKKLEPNTDYKVGNKTYKTDEHGRVKQVSGELEPNKHDRNESQQLKSGKEGGIKDGLKKDDGGHLISARHDGAGEQINYVPMDSNLNRGSWKKMENEWDGALKEGKKVEVDINPIYKGTSKRPDKFKVIYKIDGKEFVKKFKNAPGGK